MSRMPPADQELMADDVPGFRVGVDLRVARERLGWDLPAVAAALRIKQSYLRAIEDGRLADLPGNVYAVGFLRTYAGALGLDVDEVTRRFRAEAADVNRKTELTFPAPVPERGVPAGAIALVGLVLAVGAYVGWYHLSSMNRQAADAVPDVPARLAPLADRAASPTPSPQVASVLPSTPAPSAASTPLTSSPAGAPVPAMPQVPPSQAAAAMPPPVAAPAPSAAPPSDVTTDAAAAPDAGKIVLKATADAWVQVREKSGPVLLNRVLRAGDTWDVPADKPQLLLTTGNAGGTQLLIDGVATAPLGSPGAVRRDLPLDPDMIRAGKLSPAGNSTSKPAGQ